jgi:NAD(P)-dependent dehydrogenase (short-subunit alcohol dehydrogenase family)
MAQRMDGKVALVTGGASGIGRAAVLDFVAQGASVVVADVDTEGGDETARLVKEQGGEGLFVHTDVSRTDDVEAVVARAVEAFGGLDYAFNCAATAGEMAPTADCTEANWDRTVLTNLKGVWLCLKAEIAHMLANGGGAIVNASSVAGLIGFPGLPAYSASKGGVIQLTRSAALEYASAGIRVNAVCPGATETPMLQGLIDKHPGLDAGLLALQPLGRIGRPEEVAHAAVWLCSDDSSFVTGQVLPVDGGWTAH